MVTAYNELHMSNDADKRDTALILTEVRGVSAAVTSLTRTVDRIDQRLGGVEQRLGGVEQRLTNVEKKTDLIPDMAAAIGEVSGDLDDHEKRITGLEQAAA
jgi:hypothetical protein